MINKINNTTIKAKADPMIIMMSLFAHIEHLLYLIGDPMVVKD